jgi:hypothetical protein
MNSAKSKNINVFLNYFAPANYHAGLKQRELQGQAVHVFKALETTRNFSVHKRRPEGLQFVSQLMTQFVTLPIFSSI